MCKALDFFKTQFSLYISGFHLLETDVVDQIERRQPVLSYMLSEETVKWALTFVQHCRAQNASFLGISTKLHFTYACCHVVHNLSAISKVCISYFRSSSAGKGNPEATVQKTSEPSLCKFGMCQPSGTGVWTANNDQC